MESDIFVVSADGRQRRRITNDPSQESDMQWSPDGAQIAYSDSNPEGGDATSSSPTATAGYTGGSHGQSPCANPPPAGRETANGCK